jgi:cell division cycle protein 37
VHPNVDKRSFIRAKQNQIHMQRQQRKHEIETLRYERAVNNGLILRISGLIDALRAHADDAAKQNPGELAFRAVMESSARLRPEDDKPPPRPEGVHANVEQPPSYTKMMAALLDQVNQSVDEQKVGSEPAARYAAMVTEIEGHLAKVQGLQDELKAKLAELEKEEGRKITSDSIHTGFDSSHVNKSKPGEEGKRELSRPELLNPGYAEPRSMVTESQKHGKAASGEGDDDEDEMEATVDGKEFATIPPDAYQQSLGFLSSHPHILAEKEQDGLMVMAFDAALLGDDSKTRQCVHQALLLQYCRTLGRDGVALFFKRIMTPGHQARDMFNKDVQDTYLKIRSRAREIVAQRAKDEAEGRSAEGVEQIQLHAVEPGTKISIAIPSPTSNDPEVKKSREIFESFAPNMREALESGNLDKVNVVLGNMSVLHAEKLVEQLGEVSENHRPVP